MSKNNENIVMLSLSSAAATISKKLGPLLSKDAVLQLTVTHGGPTAHQTILAGKDDYGCPLMYGRHVSPSLVLHMNHGDLADICQLGCLRDYISVHGEREAVSMFRLAFMSTTTAHKEAVEAKTTGDEVLSIERIDFGALDAKTFFNRYAMKGIPVIIAGAMSKWREGKVTLRNLTKNVADINVSLRVGSYASNIYTKEMQTSLTKLSAYLEQCDALATLGSDGLPPYAASNLVPIEWSEWLDYPPFINSALCGYAKFWIGPAGTVTPMHRDWADNFLTQLEGSKEVALISPSSAPLLVPRQVHSHLDSCGWIDPKDDNLSLKGVKVLFVTLDAGEMIYIPSGWFHHVRSLSLSFSVNYFLQRVPFALYPPREDPQ